MFVRNQARIWWGYVVLTPCVLFVCVHVCIGCTLSLLSTTLAPHPCALPPCSLLYMGGDQVQLQYCRVTLSVLFFHSFLSVAPSLHHSSSPDLLISLLTQSDVAFPFSCILYVFPRLLSLLVCLHPSLPSGLPISSGFSPIFLLGCIASQSLSCGRSAYVVNNSNGIG